MIDIYLSRCYPDIIWSNIFEFIHDASATATGYCNYFLNKELQIFPNKDCKYFQIRNCKDFPIRNCKYFHIRNCKYFHIRNCKYL